MEEVVIKVSKRDVIGKQVKVLRREGSLPAVLYGGGLEPTPISMDLRETSRVLAHLPASALVTLDLDGERHLALIREKQRDVILGTLTHIDFQAVSTSEKLRVTVAIQLEGEAPAVEELGGILVTGKESLLVESFPQDLPETLPVDISVLKEFGDSLYIRDITPPANVAILENLDDMVVSVSAPAAEEVEEEEEEVEEVEGAEPEVIERGKREEEEEEE